MKVILVGGARPNFVKVRALMQAIDEHNSFTLELPDIKFRKEMGL